MSLMKSGAHPNALNPVTVAKIVKIKVYPSALFGCELWLLSNTEVLRLERAQNFIVKCIQGLEKRTRTDMCVSLLGWTSIESYINIKKLLFLGRIYNIDNSMLVHKIFLTRFFMFNINNGKQQGFIPDIVSILRKYSLYETFVNFVKMGSFPGKLTWKKIVYENVYRTEESVWLERMNNDKDFFRFKFVHSKIETHYLWKLAILYPQYHKSIHFILKSCTTSRMLDHKALCHFCGILYNDALLHIILHCEKNCVIRDKLWCFLVTMLGIDRIAYLLNLSDFNLVNTLIGSKFDFDMSNEVISYVSVTTIHFLNQMLKNHVPFC